MASETTFRTRRTPLARTGVVAVIAAVAGGCGDTPRVIPTRNFDRPTAMAWVCMAAIPPENPTALSGRPLSYCHPPNAPAPKPDLAVRRFGTFGLLTNTARGEVAAVDFDRNAIVDLDPAAPSFNMVPTGKLPEVIAASPDGCRAVTANRGSCDLTMFETGRLFSGAFEALPSSADVPAPVDGGSAGDAGPPAASVTPVAGTNLVVTTRSGKILARPGELAFLPQQVASAMGNQALCAGDGAVAGAARVPWTVVVTYPSCGLVALVSLPDGRLIDSVRVTGAGVVAAGDDPSCPVECGAGVTAPIDGGTLSVPGDSDAAAADPAVATRSVLVSALAVLPNGRRLFVGGPNADFVTAVDIVGDTPPDADSARKVVALAPEFSPRGLRGATAGGRILLAEGAVGVSRLRLSVDAFATSEGGLGAFAGRRGQFLYAIALDGSMRVVSLNADQSGAIVDVECDANVDTLAIDTLPGGRSAGCHPVSDPLIPPPPRRLFSRGPGIRSPLITGDSNGLVPVPVDVTFSALVPAVDADGNPIVENVGFVLFSNGDTRLLNVDPLAPADALTPPAITHVFRNALAGLGTSTDKLGLPQVERKPSVVTTDNEVPFSLRSGLARELLPRVEGVPLPVAGSGAPTFAYAHFPRPEQAAPRTWRVTWEGVLPDTVRASGAAVDIPDTAATDGAGRAWSDAGADYCRSGVLPGDILQIRGCQETIECGDPAKFTCLHTRAAAPGICVPKVRESEQAVSCDRLIGSRRRYRVLSAERTKLQLGLSVDELVRPRLRGCQADADCRPVGATAFARFACRVIEPGQVARCVQPCGAPIASDADCRPGFVCEDTGSSAGPLCVEAPALRTAADAACLDHNGSYYVRVGKSFFVEGDFIPAFTTARADAAGVCQADTTRDPRLSNRLPLSAPDCAPTFADAAAAWRAAPAAPAAPWPNPCLWSGPNGDEITAGATGDHVKALFETSELRFVLTNLEQLWGDGLDIDFSTRGGYFPEEIALNAGVRIAVPTQILASPIPAKLGTSDIKSLFFPYVFIVDSGRLGPGGNRGQILRINTRRRAFDSANTTDLFQIQ